MKETKSYYYTVGEITHKLNYINSDYIKVLQKNAVTFFRQGLLKCQMDYVNDKYNTLIEVYDWDRLISAIENCMCGNEIN